MHAQLNIPTKKTFLFRVNDAGMSAVPVGQAVSPDAWENEVIVKKVFPAATSTRVRTYVRTTYGKYSAASTVSGGKLQKSVV